MNPKPSSPIDFFVLGPPKCGTTSICHYLGQHPDIAMSTPKEPRFFDIYYDRGLSYYVQECFAARMPGQVAGDGTATYAFLPFAADRIHRHFPHAKLIFCFRDPVERAFSDWLMRVSALAEPLDFYAAMAANKNQEAVALEGSGGARIWKDRFDRIVQEGVQAFRVYIEAGLYARQLQKYLSLFSPDQILILPFSELTNRTESAIRKMYQFLEVDPDFVPADLLVKNPFSIRKRFKTTLQTVMGRNNAARLLQLVPGGMKKALYPLLDNVKSAKPILSDEDRSRTAVFFEADSRELRRLMNSDTVF